MTVQLTDLFEIDAHQRGSASWQDPTTSCTMVAAHPANEPELWRDYVDGAARSYRKHGVECALDMDVLRSGDDTAIFFAAVDDKGDVVAGLRGKGPLTTAIDSHAILEWAGQPGLEQVDKMITDRIPFGVMEMKSAWVGGEREQGAALAKALARSGYHTMSLLNVQFVMATAGAHVLSRWKSSGGVVAKHIPSTPYPDPRYQTSMMWWDRRTILTIADPDQVSTMMHEAAAINRYLNEVKVLA